MSTARKVLMIIAFVASIIAFCLFAICAACFFISSNNEEVLNKVLDGMSKSSMTLEEGKTFVTIMGVTFCILAFFELINACLSFKGIKSSRAGLMVINIVFGVLSGIYINSLGGIFGLVDGKKDWF